MADETEAQTTETTEAPDIEALQDEQKRTAAALSKANKEAEKWRKRVQEFEEAEAQRQQAAMTELDRAKAEIEQARKDAEEARTEARAILIRSAFVAEAAKAGAAYPEDVFALADKSGVEVGEDGQVAGVAEAVKALVDSGRIPLAGKAPAPKLDGGAGGVERPGTDPAKLTALELDLAKKLGLSPEKYAQNKAAIAARSD